MRSASARCAQNDGQDQHGDAAKDLSSSSHFRDSVSAISTISDEFVTAPARLIVAKGGQMRSPESVLAIQALNDFAAT
jgi:hypothetical protein